MSILKTGHNMYCMEAFSSRTIVAILYRCRRQFLIALLVIACSYTSLVQATERALLIGVSNYVFMPVNSLSGPKNDVRLIKEMLIAKGFSSENIAILADGVADSSKQPTKKNIIDSFEKLATNTQESDSVFVYFSGHGSQQLSVISEGNVEPDQLDEMFLPMDAKKGETYAKNVLLDNEINILLKNIHSRARFVMAVFDFCHSGTATRSSEAGVAYRDVPSESLVSDGDIQKKLKTLRIENKFKLNTVSVIDLYPKNMMALFATQPDQKEPERVRKIKIGGQEDWNTVGQLTYHLILAANKPEVKNYQDLKAYLSNAYAAEMKTKKMSKPLPTPLFEGEMSEPVLWNR